MGSSKTDSTIKYAPYWEIAHQDVLNHSGEDTTTTSVVAAFNTAIANSPFSTQVDYEVRDAFFGDGYQVESFPSLWDMFGKFMAGLDLHLLFQQTYNDLLTSPEINDTITAQAAYLDDDIETNILPRFHGGMRNINAVNSSGFMAGRALIEDTRIKNINKFASEIRLRVLDVSAQMWSQHLNWNSAVISTYAGMNKQYFATEMDVEAHTTNFQMRDAVWELSMYEYIRAMMGVVSGAQGTVQPPEPSQASKTVSGALGGAAVGYQVGGGYGAIVGGIVGAAASFL